MNEQLEGEFMQQVLGVMRHLDYQHPDVAVEVKVDAFSVGLVELNKRLGLWNLVHFGTGKWDGTGDA